MGAMSTTINSALKGILDELRNAILLPPLSCFLSLSRIHRRSLRPTLIFATLRLCGVCLLGRHP